MTLNQTSFKPGQSGNTKGRPKGTGKYRDESALHTNAEYNSGPKGMAGVEARNVSRVRAYLEANLGCLQKEVCTKLNLNRRTVSKAIKIIRGRV